LRTVPSRRKKKDDSQHIGGIGQMIMNQSGKNSTFSMFS